MRLRHASALNVATGCAGAGGPAMTTNQDHLPVVGGKRLAPPAGALQLAAIVHYDPVASYLPAAAARNKSRLSPDKCDMSTSSDSQQVAGNTHEDGKRLFVASGETSASTKTQMSTKTTSKKKTTSNKFSRLFFTKNNGESNANKSKQAQHDGETTATAVMIDSRESERAPGGSCGGSGGESAEFSGESRAAGGQVIEFKFDLIVEGERGQQQQQQQKLLDNESEPNGDELPATPATSAGHSLRRGRKILRPIQQRKLLDQVNELVESFVLDSTDVCLMTTGRSGDGGNDVCPPPFEYLLQSAELTLSYAFQLLEAVKSGAPAAQTTATTTTCSPLRVDERSIELEALLFSEGQELEVLDLTAGLAAGRDCTSAQEALALLGQIEAQVVPCCGTDQQQQHLMINLKLKQQVQGGLFTNRMCLLDLGERPHASPLRPVLESIFSGQALAYLKGQKVRLHELELAAVTSSEIGSYSGQESPTPQSQHDAAPPPPKKHGHHFASSARAERKQQQQLDAATRLSQGEWLAYKALSSALIKSLMIVHCRRLLAATQLESRDSVRAIERHLMGYNLNLLEFASAIKRAAASRLRRRKRHLQKSHLAASNSHLSLATGSETTHYHLMDSEYRSGSPPGFESVAHHHHQHRQQDLMISQSPFRPEVVHRAHCCESPPPPPPHLAGLPAHLIERYTSSYSPSSTTRKHHRHRPHNHKHQHNHRRHHRCDYEETTPRRHRTLRHKCARHSGGSTGRATSLNRQNCSSRHDSHLGGGGCCDCEARGLELETSSQLSTSSSSGGRLAGLGRQCVTRATTSDRGGDELDLDSLAASTSHWLGPEPMRRALPLAANSVASWAARARLQLQRHTLLATDQGASPAASEQSAAGTLDDSIELASFSGSSGVTIPSPAAALRGSGTAAAATTTSPPDADPLLPPPPPPLESYADHGRGSATATTTESDLGGRPVVVAEPPRQLKLEQFLNRLTSEKQVVVTGATNREGDDGDDGDDDDDDDCRSHSSILEHLSSLTLGSTLKMGARQLPVPAGQPTRVSIVGESDPSACRWPLEGTNGHLQQLLKSTLKLHQQQQQQQQQQQSPLTIDCGGGEPAPPAQSLQRRTTTDGFTPPTSMESGCSSHSSSSSSGRGGGGGGGGSELVGGPQRAKMLFVNAIEQNT